jgi:hypothetical protein
MRSLGLEPDPWQVEVLEADHPRLLLNCCRQAGKSTVVALLGLAEAVFVPHTRVLLVSRSHRQSRELFRIIVEFYRRLGSPLPQRLTADELQLSNFSRVVCLPCKEETVRGYANVSLLVIDEAARVPDDLYRAVRPMLAVSRGRLICLSTPYGRRGFFHDAWADGGADWARIEVPADRVARISPAFLAQERRALGASWYRQEYGCSFEALQGLVYPDFARCVVSGHTPEGGRRVGGIDFGFRNPFAAVWGVVDGNGVLWLTGEHYSRQRPLTPRPPTHGTAGRRALSRRRPPRRSSAGRSAAPPPSAPGTAAHRTSWPGGSAASDAGPAHRACARRPQALPALPFASLGQSHPWCHAGWRYLAI